MKTHEIILAFELLLNRVTKIGHGEVSFTVRVRHGRIAQILRTVTESHLIEDCHDTNNGCDGSTTDDENSGNHNEKY